MWINLRSFARKTYKMRKEFSDLIDKLLTKNRELGLLQLTDESQTTDGRTVTVKGKEMVYFGSCNYLGLETDQRLKDAAKDAIDRFGTQTSYSRAGLSNNLYDTLESKLGEIFGKPTLLAPTTSLGHVSVIPVIIGERDALIMDHQVHNSVKNAVQMVKADGVYTEILKHNRVDYLETRIQILKQTYDRVWYFCDGVYSMYGDSAPFKELWQLLDKYDQFNLYVDDAHGMSWAGQHGRGMALSKMPFHPRMILTTSLAKGFANCGGALVFGDEQQKSLIRNCGSSFIFSGPLQPAVLASGIASADIHLSEEIESYQNDLFERMLCFVERAKELGLPVINNELTPIFFVGTSKAEVGYKLVKHLMDRGMLIHQNVFPTVPMKNAGLRVALTNHISIKDIHTLLDEIAEVMPKFLAEENFSMEQIHEAFGLTNPAKAISDIQKLKIA